MPRTDLADLVADAARRSGQSLALVRPDGTSLTWAAVEQEVARVASGLADLGVVAGQRVVICLPNRVEFVVTWFAVLRAQAVAVPVDPRSSGDGLRRMLADCSAVLAVGDEATAPRVREAADSLRRGGESPPHLVVVDGAVEAGETGYDQLQRADTVPVPPIPDREKPAALLYTAGTSGRPRGAVLTHRAMLANLEQLGRVNDPVTRDDVVLGALPLFHVYGLNAVLGTVAAAGATLVLEPRFRPAETLDLARRTGVTVLPVAPGAFEPWLALPDLAERLTGVRLVLSGSAPLPSELAERFRVTTGHTVHQGYGLTEAAPVVASTLVGDAAPPGSVGSPLPGVELRLVGPDGRDPEAEDPGEIEIRGANLFSGYWPDGADGPRADGWWPTGDLGLQDAAGHLFLADRVAEVVTVSGFSVYPHEIEAVLAEIDGVRAAGVVGVRDPEAGSVLVAYLVAPRRDPRQVVAEAHQRCQERLAGFKQPVRVEVTEELPISATGRVQRGRLRLWEERRTAGLLG